MWMPSNLDKGKNLEISASTLQSRDKFGDFSPVKPSTKTDQSTNYYHYYNYIFEKSNKFRKSIGYRDSYLFEMQT